MFTYFILDPFEFPYYFYCIRGELIYVLSIVACIPSTNMLKQKLHHFCNRSSPDDGPKSGKKYQGYIQVWTIHKSIPSQYDKSNTGIRTDPEENM